MTIEARQAKHLAQFFAYRLYDILFRRQTLRWVAGWAEQTDRRFRLYGRGWSDDPLLAKYAVGPIEQRTDFGRRVRSPLRAVLIERVVQVADVHDVAGAAGLVVRIDRTVVEGSAGNGNDRVDEA